VITGSTATEFVQAQNLEPRPTTIRIATFNCSLNRDSEGELARGLAGGLDPQARKVARILRIVRPQIVLLNEFDFDSDRRSLDLFRTEYLEASVAWSPESPVDYPFAFTAPVNTGVPSGRDLDHEGSNEGPGDAIGFGRFPGQYGMVIFSQFPIDQSAVRTFQNLLWKDIPGALLPPGLKDGNVDATSSWYSADDLLQLRLSSKSHWDVPVLVNGKPLHILASHPTPPAFDGPEVRNGRRNHDEIRLWAEYLSDGEKPWLRDDQGRIGTLPVGERFVILGDQNADPFDGGSVNSAINQLLRHPRVNSTFTPRSAGGEEASQVQKGANQQHQGPSAEDTADFSDRAVGNLRADYVLPEKSVSVTGSGIFWPKENELGADLVNCSDHRLVWIDVAW
jgi:hypothetical protein